MNERAGGATPPPASPLGLWCLPPQFIHLTLWDEACHAGGWRRERRPRPAMAQAAAAHAPHRRDQPGLGGPDSTTKPLPASRSPSGPSAPRPRTSSMLTQLQPRPAPPTHLGRGDLTASPHPSRPSGSPSPGPPRVAPLGSPLPPRPRPLLHARPSPPPPAINQGATPGDCARSSGSPASWRQSHHHYLQAQDALSSGHELLCWGKRLRDIIL